MKRIIVLLMSFIVISLAINACQGKKGKEQVKTEDLTTEVQITQELKNELIKKFEEYQQVDSAFFKSMKEKKHEKRPLPDEVELPLNYAEKAQTLDQKYFLMGMYLQEVMGNRYFNGINDEERAKAVAKLALETNLSSMANMDWNQAMKKNWDELHKTKAETMLADFKTALDNKSADKFIQIILGVYVESKYLQYLSRKANKELDKNEPSIWLTHTKLELCIVELVDKMMPYYPSLNAVLPLISDIKAMQVAATGKGVEDSYAQFISGIQKRRAAFLAELK
jgi:hypothetical protein